MTDVEAIRWVLEKRSDEPGIVLTFFEAALALGWPEGWFSVRSSDLHENERVMVWARTDDGLIEPAVVMHRITKFDENGEALYALRFEED